MKAETDSHSISPLGADAYIAEQRQQWAAADTNRHLASIDSKLSVSSKRWGEEAPLASDGISQIVYQSVPVPAPGFSSGDLALGAVIVAVIYIINKRL